MPPAGVPPINPLLHQVLQQQQPNAQYWLPSPMPSPATGAAAFSSPAVHRRPTPPEQPRPKQPRSARRPLQEQGQAATPVPPGAQLTGRVGRTEAQLPAAGIPPTAGSPAQPAAQRADKRGPGAAARPRARPGAAGAPCAPAAAGAQRDDEEPDEEQEEPDEEEPDEEEPDEEDPDEEESPPTRKRGRPKKGQQHAPPRAVPKAPGSALHPAVEQIVRAHGCEDVRLSAITAKGALKPLRRDAKGKCRYALRVRADVEKVRAREEAGVPMLPPLRNVEIHRQEELQRLSDIRDEYRLYKKIKKKKKQKSRGGAPTAVQTLDPRPRPETSNSARALE